MLSKAPIFSTSPDVAARRHGNAAACEADQVSRCTLQQHFVDDREDLLFIDLAASVKKWQPRNDDQKWRSG